MRTNWLNEDNYVVYDTSLDVDIVAHSFIVLDGTHLFS